METEFNKRQILTNVPLKSTCCNSWWFSHWNNTDVARLISRICIYYGLTLDMHNLIYQRIQTLDNKSETQKSETK